MCSVRRKVRSEIKKSLENYKNEVSGTGCFVDSR